MFNPKDLRPYPHKFLCYQTLKEGKNEYGKAHIYSFRSEKTKRKYIIRLEELPNQLFLIKFYQKIPFIPTSKKYKILTQTNDTLRIVATCIMVVKEVLNKNELASFGCIGARGFIKKNKEIIEETTENKTKRFKIWSLIFNRIASQTRFKPYDYEEKSIYIRFNTKNIKDEEKIIREWEQILKELDT